MEQTNERKIAEEQRKANLILASWSKQMRMTVMRMMKQRAARSLNQNQGCGSQADERQSPERKDRDPRQKSNNKNNGERGGNNIATRQRQKEKKEKNDQKGSESNNK